MSKKDILLFITSQIVMLMILTCLVLLFYVVVTYPPDYLKIILSFFLSLVIMCVLIIEYMFICAFCECKER